jgi:hypothetical protein
MTNYSVHVEFYGGGIRSTDILDFITRKELGNSCGGHLSTTDKAEAERLMEEYKAQNKEYLKNIYIEEFNNDD